MNSPTYFEIARLDDKGKVLSLQESGNQELIFKFVLNDGPNVRQQAVQLLTDQTLLLRVALESSSDYIPGVSPLKN